MYKILALALMLLSSLTLQAENFTKVAKNSIPAVVSIQVKGERKPQSGEDPLDFFNDPFFRHFFGTRPRSMEPELQVGQGSGFIISKEGHILTNSHVVQDAKEIKVLLNDGQEYKAQVVGSDTNTDLALIKIDGKDLPFLELGDSDALEIAEPLLAIGNTLGLQATVTSGIVSAKGRSDLDITRIEDFIQTDAAINRGNSGGPLLNLDGKVVGINTAIVTNIGTGGYMGVGFAIPSNMAKLIKEELLKSGSFTRGYLGISPQGINHDLAKSLNLPKAEGVLIASIEKNSPAEKSGLLQGDVIVKINGNQITGTGQFRTTVAFMKPETSAKLDIIRKGTPLVIDAQIGTFKDAAKDEAPAQTQNSLGIEVETLTPELAQRLGITGERGVVITKVNPKSSAAFAGLKSGVVIQEVNQEKVDSPESFNKALENSDKGRPVLLLIKYGESVRYLSLWIE